MSASAQGGFDFPCVYEQNPARVLEVLAKGEIDYADLPQWQFPDAFLSFVLGTKFLEFVDRTYPNPRAKNEVPIWFLVTCQFLLRLHQAKGYHRLTYLLHSGSVLLRTGFNVSRRKLGFNDKNKTLRHTAVHPDTVRKFFKDTDPKEIRSWFNESLQGWFRGKRAWDSKGLFILDQTHLVVPDNDHYEGAVYLPVDEHGQRYKGLERMSDEQKKALIYHPCYTLSTLLHLNPQKDLFHVAGYERGPGNEDELPQAERLVPEFCRLYPGSMKELILDRGYISGPFIGRLKKDCNVNVLIPLKKEMNDYQDAFEIARRQNPWCVTENETNAQGKLMRETKSACIPAMNLWEDCPVKLHVTVSETRRWSKKKQAYETYTWALASTKKYASPKAAIERYQLRWQIEERYRQLKLAWQIHKFPSPAQGLIETHLCFTLLTYSLLQLYLRRKDLQEQAHRFMEAFGMEDQKKNQGAVVLVYAGPHYGVIPLTDYTQILVGLDDTAKDKIKAMRPTLSGSKGLQRVE